ncbi:hypothetical protein CQ041_17310 [Pseudomonas sp. MYb60]|nr:hypothetical protein CQ041_17310 [Pseudomonas sp. MYb60]
MENGIVWAVLAIPPIISIAAFYLVSRTTYGIQDRGIARYRKKLRMIGRVSAGFSTLGLLVCAIYLIMQNQ